MDKKRGASELTVNEDDDSVYAKIGRLERQINDLQQENDGFKQENNLLKAKLAEYGGKCDIDDEEDDDDDASVCDGSPWSMKYFLLKQFKQQNGHCKVPISDKQLGIWANNMKAHRRKGKLPQDRIDKLDKIGFSWGKGFPEPKTWDEYFLELEKYHGKFGHCNIHVDPNPDLRNDLAKWVFEQRKQGKRLQKCRPSSLTQEQYRQLDGLSFKWKVFKRSRS